MKADLRARLRERRRALRAGLKVQRQQLRAQRKALRPKREGRAWRRGRWVLLILLLLLLLLRQCSCDEPGAGAPQAVVPPPVPTATVAPPAVAKKKRVYRRKVKPRARPTYEAPKARAKTWLDVFRLQVAGRSPRLAACFEGVQRPGKVRWVAAVDAKTGQVSDHALEPIAQSLSLSRAQKRCLTEVLSKPPYKLPAELAPSTPQRVGLVLEF